jgi:(+)-trans-carveol dehydrogenase
MSGRLAGKVALVTGATRGQGRSHARALAREGAMLALCARSEEDLGEVVAEVEASGSRAVAAGADIRSVADMDALVASALDAFGHIDIVIANAGTFPTPTLSWQLSEADWRDAVDVNLTGAWNTVRAAIPSMIEHDAGGAIVLVGSGASAIGFPGASHYSASKHGVIGLMRSLANELAPHRIRVNAVSPSNVNTPMIMNETVFSLFAGGKPGATVEDALPGLLAQNVLPTPWVEPEDVTNAVLFLVSDDARFVTGVDLPVDAGTRVQPPG